MFHRVFHGVTLSCSRYAMGRPDFMGHECSMTRLILWSVTLCCLDIKPFFLPNDIISALSVRADFSS